MTRHKIINIFQTVIILASMTGFMVLLGVVVSGVYGLIFAFFTVFGVIFLYPSIKPELIVKLYGAKPLTSLQAPLLYAYVDQLSQRAHISQRPMLYIIASPLSIAFTVGRHTNSAIILSTALLERLELPEIVGVVAHEMAHIAHKDLWLMSLTDIISRMTAIFSLVGQLMLFIYLPAFVVADVTVPWLGIAILVLAPFINILLSLTLSKVREYDADVTAAYLVGDPVYLARALEKIDYEEKFFVARLLSPMRRSPLPSLFRTHPLTEVRIKKLLSLTIPSDIKPIEFSERYDYGNYDVDSKKIERLLRYLLGY